MEKKKSNVTFKKLAEGDNLSFVESIKTKLHENAVSLLAQAQSYVPNAVYNPAPSKGGPAPRYHDKTDLFSLNDPKQSFAHRQFVMDHFLSALHNKIVDPAVQVKTIGGGPITSEETAPLIPDGLPVAEVSEDLVPAIKKKIVEGVDQHELQRRQGRNSTWRAIGSTGVKKVYPEIRASSQAEALAFLSKKYPQVKDWESVEKLHEDQLNELSTDLKKRYAVAAKKDGRRAEKDVTKFVRRKNKMLDKAEGPNAEGDFDYLEADDDQDRADNAQRKQNKREAGIKAAKGDSTSLPQFRKKFGAHPVHKTMHWRDHVENDEDAVMEGDERLIESVVSTLKQIANAETAGELQFENGTQTEVDPTDAKILLDTIKKMVADKRDRFVKMLQKNQQTFLMAMNLALK